MTTGHIQMENQSGIYEIFNRADGKRYIGQASNFKERWKRHRVQLTRGKHHSRFLQRAWDKYGPEAFAFRIILTCAKTKEMLCFYEQQLLDKVKPEYNSDPVAGTRLGAKLTPEQCARRSTNSKVMWANNYEKMYAASGQAWKYKSGHTEETKRRISEKKKGVPQPREGVEKSAAARRGKKRPAEVVEKIRTRQIGVPKPRPSEETRAKLCEAQRQRRIREGCTLHPDRIQSAHHVRIGEQPPPKRPRKHSPETIVKLCIAARTREERKRAAAQTPC